MGWKDAGGMANSVDPDHLIWVYTVCPGLSVRKLGVNTVFVSGQELWPEWLSLEDINCLENNRN